MRKTIIAAIVVLLAEAAFGTAIPCYSGINRSNASHASEEQAYCFWYSEAPKLGTSPEVWDYLDIFFKTSTSSKTLAIAANGAREILHDNLPRFSTSTLAKATEVLREASSIDDPRVTVSIASAFLSLGPTFEGEAKQHKEKILKRFWSGEIDAYYLMDSWGSIMDTPEMVKFCDEIIDRNRDHRSVFSAVNQIANEEKFHPKTTARFAPEIVEHLKKVMATKDFGFAVRVNAAETLQLFKALSADEVYKFTLGAIMDPGELSDTYERWAYGLRVYQIVKANRPGHDEAVRIAVRKFHIDKEAEESAKNNASSSNRETAIYFEMLKAYR
jgi:hypothetical protein